MGQVANRGEQFKPGAYRKPRQTRIHRGPIDAPPLVDPYVVGRLSGGGERLLCLFYGDDGSFRAEQAWTGNLSSVTARRIELMRAAVASDARYALVAHNHPSGDPLPSRRDIDATRRLHQMFAALGISLADHVIVASDGLAFSFRLAGLI